MQEREWDDLISDVLARLPELEWRLAACSLSLLARLPRGLFQTQVMKDGTGSFAARCMIDVRRDLALFSQQTSVDVKRFLAQKISEKINVLLRLCDTSEHQKNAKTSRPSLDLQKISTRQQWLGQLQQEIERLIEVHHALEHRLSAAREMPPEVRLKLQAELGDVTRHLSKAKESFAVASGEGREPRNYQ